MALNAPGAKGNDQNGVDVAAEIAPIDGEDDHPVTNGRVAEVGSPNLPTMADRPERVSLTHRSSPCLIRERVRARECCLLQCPLWKGIRSRRR